MTNDNYITVPGWAIRELGLSGHTLLVYSLIWSYCRNGGSFYMSKAQMAKLLNVAINTVKKALRQLIAYGYIREVEVNTCTPYVYDCVPLEEIDGGQNLTGSEIDGEGVKNLPLTSQNLTGRGSKSDPNNKIIINNDNKTIVNSKGTTPKKSAPRFIKPSLSEIREFIFEKGYQVSAETFFNYYESNGWKVGRNPMKNWKAAVCHWQTKDKKGLTASSDYKAPRASSFSNIAAATAEVFNSFASHD